MNRFTTTVTSLTVLCLAGCGVDATTAGAASPGALLEKLLDGLDQHDPEIVASCFDRGTDEGHAVAQIMYKAVSVIRKTKQFEAEVRDRFGEAYVKEHIELPGPALFLDRLRKQLASKSLSVGDSTARFSDDPQARTVMHAPDSLKKKWFLTVPAPFVGDAEIVKGVNILLEVFNEHADQALKILRPSQNEAAFRVEMAKLAINTKQRCDAQPEEKSVMRFLWRQLGERGIRRW